MSDDQQAELEDRGDVITEVETPEPTEAPEPAPQPEPEPEARPAEREIHVPKSRFDEVNERYRAADERYRSEHQARIDAEARLRELQTPKPPPFDAKAAERAYLAAVADGDTDKAATLFEQIREHDRRGITEQLSAQVRAELAATREQMALEAAAETVVDKYPFLDAASPDANLDAIKEVVEWRDYYAIAKKMAPAQALKQAAARVAPAYVKTGQASSAQQTAEQRAQAQRQTNAKAMAAQPPNTAQAGIGERATRAVRADVAKMTDAEFAALPDAERAKLRGDVVA